MLAEYLKTKRLEAGLSQGAVAKKMGYRSPQFVSNWERSLSNPPITTVKKLALLYNVNAKELKNIFIDAELERVRADLESKFNKGA